MVSRAALLAVALLAAPAAAQRVCEEELAGTCLKWREEEPTRAAPAPAPPPPSAEAIAEQALGLDADARRRVQAALNRAGFEAGMPDGAFGPQTRRALLNWQRATGRVATGYLAAEEAEALEGAARPAPSPAPAPVAVAPREAPEPESASPISAEMRHGASRFALRAEPADSESVTLSLRMTTQNRSSTFEQTCRAPRSGPFECILGQSGWNRVRVEGALPEVTLRFDPRTLIMGDPNAQDSPGLLTLTLQ
ncbi:MAG: peptidoglycan-binding domain-containing protein [Pikeienuella sp.]|uniref:peptidoglycan-binding domain-containing protein n=1 Tax=Pikeienuella sp. TaxID=2831957 RepID=UPI003918A7F5